MSTIVTEKVVCDQCGKTDNFQTHIEFHISKFIVHTFRQSVGGGEYDFCSRDCLLAFIDPYIEKWLRNAYLPSKPPWDKNRRKKQ